MGDYVVLKRVAIGGMAEIFLGRKDGMSGFERLVVLKRILPELAHNEDFVRMFLNEARIAATLHHTNIVQVYSIGEELGKVFFAMEFLHGEDLSRVLSRANQIGRPPQLDGVLTIASAVCAGLHYAHERTGPDGKSLGIVHRDVSPHNVFVTYDGNIKLLDFGIAKATTSFGHTRTGVLKGKVAYMSPEQAYSQPVDRRSDIFCMGILLWELTTGRRLYRRRSELETLKALVDEDAPKPSTVVSSYPQELEEIVMRCLHRDPSKRYTTCDELSQSLERFAENQNLGVSPLIATRMMRTLFRNEIAAYEAAVKSGSNLVDQVVARMEATARKSSLDDWDGDVESIIVDIHADADRTSMSGPPRPEDGPTQVEVAPMVMPPPVATKPPPPAIRKVTGQPVVGRTPTPVPHRPTPPPGPAVPRTMTPPPGAFDRPTPTPPPAVMTPPPGAFAQSTPTPTPGPAIPRTMTPPNAFAQPTPTPTPIPRGGRNDLTQRIDAVAPMRMRPRGRPWPIVIGAGAAVIVIAVIVAKSGGGDARTTPTAEPNPTEAVEATQPDQAAPAEPVARPNEGTAVAKPDEPASVPAVVKTPPPPPNKIAKTPKRPEPSVARTERVAKRPEVKRPRPRPKVVPKKTEPKKTEPKKPTAKDLDSLPL